MAEYKILNASLKDLYDEFVNTNGLLKIISKPAPLRNSSTLDLIIKRGISDLPMENAFIYTGMLKDVVLVKKKYFHTRQNNFLWKGLSYHNYMLHWDNIENEGNGGSTSLLKNNTPISMDLSLKEEINDECIFVGGDSIVEVNWAHWFFEHILKLKALSLSGVDMALPIIVSERLPNRFLLWGDKLLETKLNWIKINLENAIRFRKVYLSSASLYRKENMMPACWNDGFTYMRSTFLKQSIFSDGIETFDVLFISRETARWRKAINENILFQIAAKELKAKKINMMDYNIESQVKLISKAKIIILFAGADGPISLFADPKASVFEIVAPNHAAINCSLAFCALNNGNYIRLVAKSSVEPQLGPNHMDKNYLVDEDKYLQCISSLKKIYRYT